MIHWVDQQLIRWGQWLQTGRGLGSAGLTANWEIVGRSNVRSAVIPVKDIECSRTHDWVATLPEADQVLLYRAYCTPKTARQNAVILGCSLRTMYARLHRLHVEYARGREERAK